MGVVRLLWPDQRARERWSRAESPHSPPCGEDRFDVVGKVVELPPHVRGEDLTTLFHTTGKAETPPRAWGRLLVVFIVNLLYGNTPTCVGKTY